MATRLTAIYEHKNSARADFLFYLYLYLSNTQY